MNDLHEMMPHAQIFENNQNHAVWPHPPPRYPPAFKPHPCRGSWSKRRDFQFHRTGSFPVHSFKPANPNRNDSKSPPANRTGAKGRRIHHPKRIFGRGGVGSRLTPPFAPRNTTSFIIQAKIHGGAVSPAANVSPPAMPAASLSPATFDEKAAKEQWGFNGYGSMKGLIRLRPGNFNSGEDSGAGRFEMVYPNSGEEHTILDKRVSEQGTHIAHLEEQNLTLKERLLFMERQLDDMRRRVQFLETDGTTTSRRGSEGGAENFLSTARDVCSVGNGDHNNNGDKQDFV